MEHKVGDIVVLAFPDEKFFENFIDRKTYTILDIVDNDEYLLAPGIYADDTDTISLNVVINNLESLISKAKKQLKTFKKLKESRNAT